MMSCPSVLSLLRRRNNGRGKKNYNTPGRYVQAIYLFISLEAKAQISLTRKHGQLNSVVEHARLLNCGQQRVYTKNFAPSAPIRQASVSATRILCSSSFAKNLTQQAHSTRNSNKQRLDICNFRIELVRLNLLCENHRDTYMYPLQD